MTLLREKRYTLPLSELEDGHIALLAIDVFSINVQSFIHRYTDIMYPPRRIIAPAAHTALSLVSAV